MPERALVSRSRRKQARPRELLDAALALFVEKGFAATRTEEVAARAGVSKGALYLYFDSKKSLLEGLIAEHFSSRVAIGAYGTASAAGPSAELLRNVLTPWVVALREAQAGGVFKLIFTEARTFPALAEFWSHDVVEPMRQLISCIVARGIARGEFRRVDPELVVHSLLLPVVMTCLVRHGLGHGGSGSGATDAPDLFSRHLEFVLEGLNHRPAGPGHPTFDVR